MNTQENAVAGDNFLASEAFQTLNTLSKTAVDLTDPNVLTGERLKKYAAEACGFKLLYATERVNDDVLEALENLSKDCNVLKKMQAMQEGEVINKIEGFESENRAVLHTAMRDHFDAPHQTPAALEAAKLAQVELDKLKSFLDNLVKIKGFTDLVMIGIGGSDLGPRAFYTAMKAYSVLGRNVHFVANVDPDDVVETLKGVDLEHTLAVVVSKSGTTLETLTNEELVKSHFTKAGLDPKEHFVAVTGKGSPMDDPDKYLESFYIWDYVGGRYSVTSMVGGVMLGFGLGYDNFIDLLKGANAMDRVALNPRVQENLPLLSALIGVWNRNFLNHATVAVIPYSEPLSRFPAHLQQCNMESNGKHINKEGKEINFSTGPVIWGEPGTNGQHSFFQLIHQGTDVVPVEFIGFKESQYEEDLQVKGSTSQEKLLSNLFAQSLALTTGQKSDNPNKVFTGNRPNRILLAKKLTPYSLGALLSYYENMIAFQGFIWNVNSFDQEGVQLGKVLANKMISLFAAKKGADTTQEPFPTGEAFLDHLDSL
jgi:glucose-6-phosphate isomerase